jgi:hypothetical protein
MLRPLLLIAVLMGRGYGTCGSPTDVLDRYLRAQWTGQSEMWGAPIAVEIDPCAYPVR